MTTITLAQAIQAAQGSANAALTAIGTEKSVTGFVVDSRSVRPGVLFVAIAGENVDGHDFAQDAVNAGAVAVLASRELPDVPCIVVDDAVLALGRIAHWYRTRVLTATVIGVTGSSGKTTTKDLIADVLPGNVVAARGSFNTEVGLPLSIMEADASTDYLVLEMGMRGLGHIRYLAEIAEPDIGVVLNVGLAHVGLMDGPDQIARAKSELVQVLSTEATAVLNADDPAVRGMAKATNARVVLFGESQSAAVRAESVSLDASGRANFCLRIGDAPGVSVALNLHGQHFVSAALAAATVASTCGVPIEQIASALEAAGARSPHRMEVRTSAHGVTVINDSYNANPDSMRAALKTLRSMAGEGRTWAVLGEMRELGDHSLPEHDAIGRLVVRLDISRLICVGSGTRVMHLAASNEGSWADESVWVEDVPGAIEILDRELQPGDSVLIKASRAIGLEVVAEHLLAGEEEAE